MCEDSRKNPPK